MIDIKEKTALATSVGADERQSIQVYNTNIIPTENTEINYPDENSSENLEEIYRQMQRMNAPAYLHTVSMNDLYETVFRSRPPVIDGLLRHLPVRRSAQGRQVILHGSACLPHQHRTKTMGLCCPQRYGFIPCPNGRLPETTGANGRL